jgi:hypothetical protein
MKTKAAAITAAAKDEAMTSFGMEGITKSDEQRSQTFLEQRTMYDLASLTRSGIPQGSFGSIPPGVVRSVSGGGAS